MTRFEPRPPEVVAIPNEGGWDRFWRILGWVRAPFVPVKLVIHPVHRVIFANSTTLVRIEATGYGYLSLLAHRVRVDGHLVADLKIPTGTGYFVATLRGFHTARARGHITPTDALETFATPSVPPGTALPPPWTCPLPLAQVALPPWEGAGSAARAQAFWGGVLAKLKAAAEPSAYPPLPPASLRPPAPNLKPPPCPPAWSPHGH
jgi:hypothetical protein